MFIKNGEKTIEKEIKRKGKVLSAYIGIILGKIFIIN